MLSTKDMTLLGFGLMVLANLGLTIWMAQPHMRYKFYRDDSSPQSQAEYTYIGDDFPISFPIGDLDTVALDLFDTVHFPLVPFNVSGGHHSADLEEERVADEEWNLLVAKPNNFGRARLGPEHRILVVTFYHQMHCLRRIQLALVNRQDPMASAGHVNHCLNHLRQTFLCESAHATEAGDFMLRNYDDDRGLGQMVDTLICRDWEQVYQAMDKNEKQWSNWKNAWN